MARIRPGYDVAIIDMSAGGVLVESGHRLLPGARVDVRGPSDRPDVEVARGRVVRCSVVHVRADRIAYQGAIVFDGPCAWTDYHVRHGYAVPGPKTWPSHETWAEATRDLC
jgi:PilZ domain